MSRLLTYTKHVTLAKIMITCMTIATISATLGIITKDSRFTNSALVFGNLSGLSYQIRSARIK